MVNRDYTKEVGLRPTQGTVPTPVAVAVLTLLAATVSFGIVNMHKHRHVHVATVNPESVQVFVRN